MTDQLRDYARQLKLGNIEELYDRVEFKEKRQYLTDLLGLMLEQRRAKRADRLIKKAGFPTIKTLEGYDFSPITFPAGLNRAALTGLDFISKKDNILMLGSVEWAS